ncbi:hypothetical protein EC950183_2652, partial [Escherichia coli 95.0183]
MAQMMKMKSRA